MVSVQATTVGTNNGANGAAAKRKSKILLVDDNQMVCKAIGRLLEISGHEVAVAFDGKSALETVAEISRRRGGSGSQVTRYGWL